MSRPDHAPGGSNWRDTYRTYEKRRRPSRLPAIKPLKLTMEPITITVTSEVIVLVTHKLRRKGKYLSVQCAGPDICVGCLEAKRDAFRNGDEDWRLATDTILRFYFFCQHQGEEWFLELGRPCAEILDKFGTELNDPNAMKLEAWKTGESQQAWKMCKFLRYERAEKRSAERFFSQICQMSEVVTRAQMEKAISEIDPAAAAKWKGKTAIVANLELVTTS